MSGFRRAFVFGAIVMLVCGRGPSPAYSQSAAPAPAQLDKLVAPIALYPDPLVAQILPASTYPVEVIEAARALASGSRPSKATASQWDPSIQSLLSYPTVLKMMSDKINWTTQLGQAVAANQSAVMAAIQSVRRQAQTAGNLRSNDKQVVSVQGSGDSSTVVIEPANPQVIYVPQYNPVAILAPAPAYYYGDPAYGLMTFGRRLRGGSGDRVRLQLGVLRRLRLGHGQQLLPLQPEQRVPRLQFRDGRARRVQCQHRQLGRVPSRIAEPTRDTTPRRGRTAPTTRRRASTARTTRPPAPTTRTGRPGTTTRVRAPAIPRGTRPRRRTSGAPRTQYRANQYKAGGASGGEYAGADPASGSRYGGTASGSQYRGSDPSRGAGGGSTNGGSLGGQRGLGLAGLRRSR